MKTLETRVLIIGGGVTGTSLARDLALRGVPCVLAEKRDLNAGASGGNHGLLHSGARYAAKDEEAARECREEGALLKRLAPRCVEDTGGLFVAVPGDDERYIADFPDLCRRCGIPATPVDPTEAREMEPALSDQLIAAFQVPDAAIDPFKLSLDNMAQAAAHGARLLRHSRVVGFDLAEGRIRTTRLRDTRAGTEIRVAADYVVSAAGAWAGEVAALAGVSIGVVCSKGTLLVTQDRITRRVVNRLRPAADGDIVVPGGTVSILGTTSIRVASPEAIRPTIAEADQIIAEGAAMVPRLADARYIRAYCGVRPLISAGGGEGDRGLSRGFALLDHAAEGVANFATISGGKLTTFRLMAEKTADLICDRLGVTVPCQTRTVPLPGTNRGRWTEPGKGPRSWAAGADPDDLLLCECEMVSQRAVDQIAAAIRDAGAPLTLEAVGLRSRVGKGPCQGCFCSQRIAGHLYDRGDFSGNQGPAALREFLNERWRGARPILWDLPLMQAELQEALHCGLFSLET